MSRRVCFVPGCRSHRKWIRDLLVLWSDIGRGMSTHNRVKFVYHLNTKITRHITSYLFINVTWSYLFFFKKSNRRFLIVFKILWSRKLVISFTHLFGAEDRKEKEDEVWTGLFTFFYKPSVFVSLNISPWRYKEGNSLENFYMSYSYKIEIVFLSSI